MASAVIASRNESTWGKSLGGFMGKKLAYSNPQLNPNPTNPSPIPNRKKPKTKKKQLQAVNARCTDDSLAVTQTASDDAYSFNQRTINANSCAGNGFNHGEYFNINISAYSKKELNELRKKLESELEQIRILNDRIESGQFPPRSSHGKTKKGLGNKRPLPVGPSLQRIENPIHQENEILDGNGNGFETLMKMCRQILMKLMKHKHSWVFNKPVDAIALGLHDYHQIVKRPMDLGSVKSNFAKNLYSSPADFASDVRLTFNNAMLYNPKTDEVHSMAAQLLSEFEIKFRPIQEKLQKNIQREPSRFVNDELQGSSWNEIPTPERPKKPKTNLMGSIPKKPELVPEPVHNLNQSSGSNPWNSNPPSLQSPVPTPSPMRVQPVKPTGLVKGAPTGKQPKPRAKDPNKREMSMEERHKLGVGLQSLPQEKMPQLVQIIRKRNEQLAQEGDEIELDIESLDTETLWELDRFVTNWKKLVSKTKRQALMGNNVGAPTAITDTDEAPVSYRNDGAKKIKKGDGEEDVDIGDEMPESSFPPVEIEKDDGGHARDNGNRNGNDNASSSSSSSGSSSSDDSSSSSDSDSGSSSGSDSDADEAQS